MNQSKFTEEEIPYNILNRFGLTREMIEDLPEGLGQRLRDVVPLPSFLSKSSPTMATSSCPRQGSLFTAIPKER